MVWGGKLGNVLMEPGKCRFYHRMFSRRFHPPHHKHGSILACNVVSKKTSPSVLNKKQTITWMLFVRPVVQHFPIKSYSSGAHRSPNRLIKSHPVQFRQSWTIIASKRTRGASSKSSTRHRYFLSEAAVGGGAMDLAKMRPIKRSSEYTEFLDSSPPHQYNILRRWVEVMSQIQKIFAP